jgi:two-component system, chemotaxis family, sensor kinase CheA
MNEFLQQFLVESRELADQATEGLLSLERTPAEGELLDSVFRALHTLKGGAGIVDFFAMERAVHAAEDVLSGARAGKRTLDARAVGDCLACIDQVTQWLDTIEASGELPPPSCESEADRIIARFQRAAAPVEPGAAPDIPRPDWFATLLERNADVQTRAATGIRYTPDPDCFFQGVDPVALMLSVPELLALEITPTLPWPALAQLDPYRCNLTLSALTGSNVAAVSTRLEGHSGECLVRTRVPQHATPGPGDLPERARQVLEAQHAMLRAADPASAGHLASAARTASNVLRFCGRHVAAEMLLNLDLAVTDGRDQLQSALAQVLAESDGAPIAAAPDQSRTAAQRAETTSRTLRVDAQRIDSLVRLTGELIVAKNGLAHLANVAVAEGHSLVAALKTRHAVFDQLIGELQRSVLALRVLPLRVVFQRFPRLLREMSESLNKPVELATSGEDTEADKTIVEMLFEPLLHVMRNAMDHGIESSSTRAAAGKPRVASIQLRSKRQGDHVVVEIADDGAGMALQRIREVAISRGIATTDALDAMSEAEIIDLIFAPGFSTAKSVTSISGRGVGMDAVRSAVERIGGRVSVETRPGLGTTVRFALPFSVMMSSVMSVEAGGQMFGVPLDTVMETVRVSRSAIAGVGRGKAIVIRQQTMPVFDLAQMLDVPRSESSTSEATLVITAVDGQLCALDVDALGERLDVILKPLDGLLSGMPGITGTTVMGDGRVLLVLDVAELLQ